MPHELLIDGNRFRDYDGFVAEFNRAYVTVFGGPPWNGDDLNDLDDFLAAPAEGLSVRWVNSRTSAAELGHAAMAAYWSRALEGCRAELPHVPSLHSGYEEKIVEATAGRGPTLFDWLVTQLTAENVGLTLDEGSRDADSVHQRKQPNGQ